MPSEDTWFKPGNKAALGQGGGRPRTAVPEKEELIQLGEKLVEWAAGKVEEGDRIRVRFCDWYTAEGFIRSQWEKMTEKPEFKWYHERARSLLALRYVDGTVNQSIAHRYLRIYDPEVRDSENEDLVYKANLTKETAEASKMTPQEALDLLKNLQSNKVERSGHYPT